MFWLVTPISFHRSVSFSTSLWLWAVSSPELSHRHWKFSLKRFGLVSDRQAWWCDGDSFADSLWKKFVLAMLISAVYLNPSPSKNSIGSICMLFFITRQRDCDASRRSDTTWRFLSPLITGWENQGTCMNLDKVYLWSLAERLFLDFGLTKLWTGSVPASTFSRVPPS